MWKLSLAHWPEYLCEAGLVALFVLADCLITIAVKYPGSPVHSWFPDPLGQRVVIGLGLGTATLLLIKSPLGEASGAHMNPAITLTFFYLGKIRLVDLCFYIIAQVTGIFATLFVLSRSANS
jgi:aquaporin Z